MLDKIKGILARRIIKNEIEYCMYCILDTINKNMRSLSYNELKNTIGKYFSDRTFINAWYNLKYNEYIVKVENTDKYIIGAQILEYQYEYLL